MRLLYKFASRSRPAKLFSALDNMQSMMHHDDYDIQITADIDDDTMFNEYIKNKIKQYGGHVNILYGTSVSKVNAINRDLPLFNNWDILINMSDDMEFIQPGFDLTIIKDYQSFAVGDVLMHYPDQAAGQALITMAIMDRKYYDRFGYIYNPEYKSLFCDNEQQEVAKLLGRYVFIKKRLFNHNHPIHPGHAGTGQVDALMRHTESFWKEDEATFNRRKAINFGI